MHHDIAKAQDDFQLMIRELGLDSLKIRDDDNKEVVGVNLQAMALPDMWLPRLMMRADDISRVLCSKKIYTCGYKYDEKTLTGISASEISNADEIKYGYSTNVLDDNALSKLIIKYVLSTSIESVNGYATLKDFESFHFLDKGDEFVRPMPEALLMASMLSEFTGKAAPMIEIALKRAHDIELEM